MSTELYELQEVDELNDVWEISKEKPVLLFKLSTTCPISAEAFNQYNHFLEDNDRNIAAYYVKVRESRPVSNQVAEDLGVKHESPQIFLVKNEQPVWHEAHHHITVESIQAALTAE